MAKINIEYIQRLDEFFRNGNTYNLEQAAIKIERIRVIGSAFNAANISPENKANIKACWAEIDKTSKKFIAITNKIVADYDGKNIDLNKMDNYVKAMDRVLGAWNSLIRYLKSEDLNSKDNICFDIMKAVYYAFGSSPTNHCIRDIHYLVDNFINNSDPDEWM